MARIIAGRAGGRTCAPTGAGTRPTSDRVQALFSALDARGSSRAPPCSTCMPGAGLSVSRRPAVGRGRSTWSNRTAGRRRQSGQRRGLGLPDVRLRVRAMTVTTTGRQRLTRPTWSSSTRPTTCPMAPHRCATALGHRGA